MTFSQTSKETLLRALELLLQRSYSAIPDKVHTYLNDSCTSSTFPSTINNRKNPTGFPQFSMWNDGDILKEAIQLSGSYSRIDSINESFIDAFDNDVFFPLVFPIYQSTNSHYTCTDGELCVLQSRKNNTWLGVLPNSGTTITLTKEDLIKVIHVYERNIYEYALEYITQQFQERSLPIDHLRSLDQSTLICLFYVAIENSKTTEECNSLLTMMFQNDAQVTMWQSHPFVSAWIARNQRGLPVLRIEALQDIINEPSTNELVERKKPLERALQYIKLEKQDIIIITAYGLLIGIVSLVTPLTINALVTTISAGVFTMPLVVLSSIIFVGILIAGGIGVAQLYVVELLQQRLFVNTAFEIAYKFPQAKQEIFNGNFAPELLNRFFDVITLQKGIRKLLIDGLSALIIGIAGLFLLMFISPALLSLGVLFLLLSLTVVYLLGRNGLKTSVAESKKKYDVAAFLEDLARCIGSFKLIGSQQYISNRVDALAFSYVGYRKEHFKVLIRQFLGFTFIRAAVNTGVLAIGGWLVFDRQITLGQLVATEIVIVTLITSLEKLTNQIEVVYDTLTAFDKVATITDIPLERRGGEKLPSSSKGMSLQCEHIAYSYDSLPVLTDISCMIESGKRVALVGKSGAGKSTLSQLFLGVLEPSMGSVLLDDIDVRRLNLESIRSTIGLVFPHDEIFDGSVWDNITLGREWVSGRDVMEAIRLTQLDEAFLQLPNGLNTQVVSHGKNLSTGQIRRIMIARAIVHKPRLLILDEAFTGIEEKMKLEIIAALYATDKPWTIISITHDPEVLVSSDMVYVLSSGKIKEIGSPQELAQQHDSHFRTIFPDLSQYLQKDSVYIQHNRNEQ